MDPSCGVAGAFTAKWTQQEFQDLVKEDFKTDLWTMTIRDDREYLCSIEINEDGIFNKAGAWDDIAPRMGLRHEYAQSRDAWDFWQDYDKIDKSGDLVDFLLSKDKPMEVPLFPPFEPEYVNEVGQPRRLESQMIRHDFQKIIIHTEAVAPAADTLPLDHTFTTWSMTNTEKDYPRKPVFHGRTFGEPERNKKELWLEFNPLTPAGASMILEVEEEKGILAGTYEWNAKKVQFTYNTNRRMGKYVVCSDEWHPVVGSKTLVLLAFDLVGNYDFWRYPVRERTSYFNRAGKYLLRDLILPYSFRLVDPQVNDRSYHVKSMSRTLPFSSKAVEPLAQQLSHLDKERPALEGKLAPGEAYIMYPGSSLVHRVSLRNTIKIQGEFVRIVPDLSNDLRRQIDMREYAFAGQFSGVYVLTDTKEDRAKASTMFTFPSKLGPVMRFKYQPGESNAIRFEMHGVKHIIFRGIWKSSMLPRQYQYCGNKGDAQLPLFGFYVNPAQNVILVEPEVLNEIPQGARTTFFPSFTAMVPHSGTYLNRERMVATQGLPVMDYIAASEASGMAQAVRSRVDMRMIYDDLDMAIFGEIPGVKDDLYERAYAQE